MDLCLRFRRIQKQIYCHVLRGTNRYKTVNTAQTAQEKSFSQHVQCPKILVLKAGPTCFLNRSWSCLDSNFLARVASVWPELPVSGASKRAPRSKSSRTSKSSETTAILVSAARFRFTSCNPQVMSKKAPTAFTTQRRDGSKPSTFSCPGTVSQQVSTTV
jgi:hypothetical protein